MQEVRDSICLFRWNSRRWVMFLRCSLGHGDGGWLWADRDPDGRLDMRIASIEIKRSDRGWRALVWYFGPLFLFVAHANHDHWWEWEYCDA